MSVGRASIVTEPAPTDSGMRKAGVGGLGLLPSNSALETSNVVTLRRKAELPDWRLKRVMFFVEKNLGKNITLDAMACAAGLSRMHFAAQFRMATGMRPHDYLLRERIARAKALLLETREPLVQIAIAVGFHTQAHFTTVFRRFVGNTPSKWRCAHHRSSGSFELTTCLPTDFHLKCGHTRLPCGPLRLE